MEFNEQYLVILRVNWCKNEASEKDLPVLSRDVTTGATGATEVFRYLDPIPTKRGRFYPPLQRSQLKFFLGYVPAQHNEIEDVGIFFFVVY